MQKFESTENIPKWSLPYLINDDPSGLTDEEITDVVGCCCTLLIPYRGHSEGYIVGDYGKDVVVRLNNGKEIVESRNDVLIYD